MTCVQQFSWSATGGKRRQADRTQRRCGACEPLRSVQGLGERSKGEGQNDRQHGKVGAISLLYPPSRIAVAPDRVRRDAASLDSRRGSSRIPGRDRPSQPRPRRQAEGDANGNRNETRGQARRRGDRPVRRRRIPVARAVRRRHRAAPAGQARAPPEAPGRAGAGPSGRDPVAAARSRRHPQRIRDRRLPLQDEGHREGTISSGCCRSRRSS